MESNLSPGPWKTDPECGDESVYDADGFMVADCAIFGISNRRGDNVANARAVSLVPQLVGYVRSSAENGCAAALALIAKLDRDSASLPKGEDAEGG